MANQKLSEYPQVDTWVKLMREKDRVNAPPAPWTRPVANKREAEQYGGMQRLRTRAVLGLHRPIADGAAAAGALEGPDPRVCLRCGGRVSAKILKAGKPKRQIYLPRGGRIDRYLCARCGGGELAERARGGV